MTDTRAIALEIINRVNKHGAFAHLALNAALGKHKDLDERDRRLITEMSYGTLKAQGSLDWLLTKVSDRSLQQLDSHVLQLLRLGAYQLWFMSGIAAHAAVNETVDLAPARSKGYINAVFRALINKRAALDWPKAEDDPVGHLSLKYYHPVWITKIWLDRFGFDEAAALMQAGNQVPPETYRVNTIKADTNEVLKSWRESGIQVDYCRYVKDGLEVRDRRGASKVIQESISQGEVQPQGQGAMLAPLFLEPESGETIVDACAAPGSKAMQMAALMKNAGKIFAIDIHESRTRLIKDSCRRLGAEIVEVIVGDALKLPELISGPVDKVLIDAPCSGLGNLNKRPDSRWRKTVDDIDRLADLQLNMLTAGAKMLRPGGLLVYSTCTITRTENEDNAARFLNQNLDFIEEPAPGYIDISDARSDIGYQLLPHRHGTEGFYIVRFRKKRKEAEV